MFRTYRKAAGLSQAETHFKTGIALKRYIRIEAKQELPVPGEVALLDKTFNANGLLVLKYCGGMCPEGKYAGFYVPDLSLQTAGLQIISLLSETERLVPELAAIIAEGSIKAADQRRYAEICGRLTKLRHCIMALEMQMLAERLPRTAEEKQEIRAFIARKKEKAAFAVGAAQTASV